MHTMRAYKYARIAVSGEKSRLSFLTQSPSFAKTRVTSDEFGGHLQRKRPEKYVA